MGHWRLGALTCALLGQHRPVLWTNAPNGPAIVCLTCHRAWPLN